MDDAYIRQHLLRGGLHVGYRKTDDLSNRIRPKTTAPPRKEDLKDVTEMYIRRQSSYVI